jgi:hypothetical protein
MTTVTAKSRTVSNGTIPDATPIEANFVELYNNDQTIATALTLIESGTITISGTKTFSGNNTHSGNNTFSGSNTFNNGVIVAGTAAANGQIGYASNQFQGYRNGALKNFLMAGDSGAFPKGYINGKAPAYASAATITIPAGLKARSGDDTADITVVGNITLSLATSGAAGLDTGSEASNTFYYVYLIKKSSDGTVSAVFSVTNEAASGSITLPSGYDLKRQLPFAVRNDGSSNIIPFFVGAGWPYRPFIGYNTAMSETGTMGTTNILSGTVGTSYTSPASGDPFVPTAIARVARYRANYNPPAAGGYISLRPTGETHEGERSHYTTGSLAVIYADFPINSNAQVEAKSTGGNATVVVDVVGYTVTEVA